MKDSPKRIRKNITQSMGESTAPSGENAKKRSASKKIFELTMASPADFFTHISLLCVLSKVKVFTWWSNNIIILT
ncbi:hypothetical protein AS592_04540 [Sulfurovum riftiae]|uniref:Uncharacterized protein n=1 Tax=Sulfurovum riftiae TaxID=1630136 RepID=A0A151CEG5_9BACT|nr:hypothetical protein AS592_04540 [Sulfurovum riftiae]